ncbi:MAG TPA: hypothetical protein VFF78_07055 [Anaerolineaceae bacterium]|nr:hypothetical protein [Anaerolineaceae bacterium]
MSQNVFPINDNTTIVLKMHADFDLQGWDRADASAVCSRRDLRVMQAEGKTLHIECHDDCVLSLPKHVTVMIEHVGGDLNVRNLDNPLTIGHVGGDLSVLDVVSLDADKIGGDVQIFDVPGAVAVRRIGSDLTAFHLGASLRADVGGDVALAGLLGDVQLRAGGDIELGLAQFGSQPVYLHAGGDIDLHVPGDINAVLNISCGGMDIDIELGGKSTNYEKGSLHLQLGQGGGELSLSAGGDVCISDEPMDEEDFKEELVDEEDDWNDRLEDLKDEDERPLGGFDEFGFEGRFTGPDREDLSRQINDRVTQAMSRVEAAMHKMNERLAQKGPRVVIPSSPHAPHAPVPPAPPAPPAPGNPAPWNPPDAEAFAADETPVTGPSEEERQLVLRMLQEKKISAEEADELLRALGE